MDPPQAMADDGFAPGARYLSLQAALATAASTGDNGFRECKHEGCSRTAVYSAVGQTQHVVACEDHKLKGFRYLGQKGTAESQSGSERSSGAEKLYENAGQAPAATVAAAQVGPEHPQDGDIRSSDEIRSGGGGASSVAPLEGKSPARGSMKNEKTIPKKEKNSNKERNKNKNIEGNNNINNNGDGTEEIQRPIRDASGVKIHVEENEAAIPPLASAAAAASTGDGSDCQLVWGSTPVWELGDEQKLNSYLDRARQAVEVVVKQPLPGAPVLVEKEVGPPRWGVVTEEAVEDKLMVSVRFPGTGAVAVAEADIHPAQTKELALEVLHEVRMGAADGGRGLKGAFEEKQEEDDGGGEVDGAPSTVPPGKGDGNGKGKGKGKGADQASLAAALLQRRLEAEAQDSKQRWTNKQVEQLEEAVEAHLAVEDLQIVLDLGAVARAVVDKTEAEVILMYHRFYPDHETQDGVAAVKKRLLRQAREREAQEKAARKEIWAARIRSHQQGVSGPQGDVTTCEGRRGRGRGRRASKIPSGVAAMLSGVRMDLLRLTGCEFSQELTVSLCRELPDHGDGLNNEHLRDAMLSLLGQQPGAAPDGPSVGAAARAPPAVASDSAVEIASDGAEESRGVKRLFPFVPTGPSARVSNPDSSGGSSRGKYSDGQAGDTQGGGSGSGSGGGSGSGSGGGSGGGSDLS